MLHFSSSSEVHEVRDDTVIRMLEEKTFCQMMAVADVHTVKSQARLDYSSGQVHSTLKKVTTLT